MALSDGVQPTLHDGEITLRPLVSADAAALYAAGQDEAIGRWTSISWPFTHVAAAELIAAATADWRAGAAARFALVIADTQGDRLVGVVSLLHLYPEQSDAEVGYWLAMSARGRGLGRRAAALLTDWALGPLGLRRLHLLTDLDNAASQAVALACGFRRSGEVFWHHPTDPGKDAPCLIFERLADEC